MTTPQSHAAVENSRRRFGRLWRDDPLRGASAFGISRKQQNEVRKLARQGQLSESVQLAEASRRWAAGFLEESAQDSTRRGLGIAMGADLVVGVVEFFTAGATAGQRSGELMAMRRSRRVARQVMDAAAPTG